MRRSPTLLACLFVLSGLVQSACTKTDATAGTPAPDVAAGATATALTPAAVRAPEPGADSLPDSLLISRADKGRLQGRESSPIWIVMISDFQCPYCKQWHDAVMADVKRDYLDKGLARMAYLNLPLQQHKYAMAEAEGAMCAGVQNKFWPFAEAMFKRQDEIAKLPAIQPELETIARNLSLDMNAFTSCQHRQAIRALVESDIAQATKIGVRSTPSFLIGDFLVEGAIPYPDFRKAIDTALVLARSAKRAR